jgi:hypothetical protein
MKELEETGIFDEDDYLNVVLKGGFHKLPVSIGITPAYLAWAGTAEFRVFEFLKNTIVRGKRKIDPLRLYVNFYLKGKLACSWSERVLEARLNMNRGNIRRYIKSLENKGYIEREKVFNPIGEKKQTVFVLGTIKLSGLGNSETLFAYKNIWEESKEEIQKAVASNLTEYYEDDLIVKF